MNGPNEAEALPGEMIDLDDARVHFTRVGAGPALVFLHGFPTSGYLWRNIQRALSGRFLCVVPDLPGLGRTEPSSAHSLSPRDQAATIANLLDALEIKRAVIVAHDLGAGVAYFLAGDRSDIVRGLVLINAVGPAAHRPGARLGRLRMPLFGDVIMVLPQGLLRFALGRRIRRGLSRRDSVLSAMMSEYARVLQTPVGRGRLLKLARAFDASGVERALLDLSRARIQRLVLWGERDSSRPLSHGRDLFDLMPSGKFVHISQAGHLLPEDQPERVAREIETFMGGLPPED